MLVLLGERSQLYDAGLVAQHLRTLTRAQVELVAGAGNDLPMCCPELILQRATEFQEEIPRRNS